MFYGIWISMSLGIKASQKIILRYIEFSSLNLAANTANTNMSKVKTLRDSVLIIIPRKLDRAQ